MWFLITLFFQARSLTPGSTIFISLSGGVTSKYVASMIFVGVIDCSCASIPAGNKNKSAGKTSNLVMLHFIFCPLP